MRCIMNAMAVLYVNCKKNMQYKYNDICNIEYFKGCFD